MFRSGDVGPLPSPDKRVQQILFDHPGPPVTSSYSRASHKAVYALLIIRIHELSAMPRRPLNVTDLGRPTGLVKINIRLQNFPQRLTITVYSLGRLTV